jgi:hypothetical protein
MANWFTDLAQKGIQAVANTAPVKTTIAAAKKPATPKWTAPVEQVVQKAAQVGQKVVENEKIKAKYTPGQTIAPQDLPAFSGFTKTDVPKVKEATLSAKKQYSETDLLDTLYAKKGVREVDVKGGVGNLFDVVNKYQSQRDGRAAAEQELLAMKPEDKQKLAFETVARIVEEKKKIFAEQEAKRFEIDVEEVIRKKLGVASFLTNQNTVKLIWDGMKQKDKDEVQKEIQAKRDKYELMERFDQSFVNSLVDSSLSDQIRGMESQVKKGEAASKPWLSLGKGMLSGATFGVSEILAGEAEKINKGMAPDTGGYEPSNRAIFEENKGIEMATDVASGVAYFAGLLGGGYLPYSAVAQQVQLAYAKIPGRLGKVLSESPVLSTYLFRNVGEEAVEAGVRKSTGQEYGFQDFMLGVMMGAGFEGATSAFKLKRVEKALVQAEQNKGGVLSPEEVESVVSPLPFNKNQSFGDIFGEKRLAFYKGLNEGRPGIDYPAPLPEGGGKIDPRVANSEAGGEVREELAGAMAGERFRTEDGEWSGYKSTFPDWVPEHLRTRKLLDAVEGHLQDGTMPKGENQKELYAIVKGRIETGYKNMTEAMTPAERKRTETEASMREAERVADEGFEGYNKTWAGLSKLTRTDEKLLFVKGKIETLLQAGFTKDKIEKLKALRLKEAELQTKLDIMASEKEIKGMKQPVDLATLKLGDDAKAARLREIDQIVARRQNLEAEIATGNYAPAQRRAETEVRKSGGVVQEIFNGVDRVLGVSTVAAGRAMAKIISAVTPQKVRDVAKVLANGISNRTPQAVKSIGESIGSGVKNVVNALRRFEGMDKDVASVIDTWNKSMGREQTVVREMMESLMEVTGSKDPATKEAIQKFLITGDSKGLSKEVYAVAKPVADEIAIEGLRQVQLGNLDIETYYKNMDQYVRRVYASRLVEGFEAAQENYNVLKNTLLDSGWDGQGAEKFITDLEMGAVQSRDLQRLATITGKGTEVSGEGVQAGAKGVTGGFLEKRVLGDDNISVAIREFLGEIKDPYYLAQKTMWTLKRSRLNYQLYKSLEGTGIIKDKLQAGEAKNWVKIEGNTFGKEFNGQYMDKKVYDFLQRVNAPTMDKDMSTWGQIVRLSQQANSFMKANVTSRNPAGQFRNFVTNFSNSRTILGHNFQSARGVKELIDAARELRKGGEFLDELKAYGRLEGQFNKEIFGEMEAVFKDTKPNKLTEAFQKIDKMAGDLYQFNDMLFMMANYKKLRAKGQSPLKALAEANRVTPNYSEISPALKKLRSNLFGLPFVTWRAKVYPEIVKEVFKHPVRGLQDLWIPAAVSYGVASQLDMTKEEQEMIATKFLRDGEIPMYRDPQGNIVTVNYMGYTPFADLFKGRNKKDSIITGWVPDPLVGYVQGNVPGVGSLVAQTFLNLDNNYDPFLRRKITDAEYGSPEWWMDVGAYVSSPAVPFFGNVPKLTKQVLSGKLDVMGAMIKGTTGITLDGANVGGFEKSEQYRNPDFSFDKREMEIKKEVERIEAMRSSDPEKARAETLALKEKYPDKVEFMKERSESFKRSVRTKAQSKIRTEAVAIVNLAKTNKDAANARKDALKAEYPDLADYVSEKIIEEREKQGI